MVTNKIMLIFFGRGREEGDVFYYEEIVVKLSCSYRFKQFKV